MEPSGVLVLADRAGNRAEGPDAVVEGVKGTWQADPSLLGQPFSGRVALLSPFDRLIHRKAGVLQVNAVHQDITFDKTMTAAVAQEIKDLAHWLGLELMPR